MTNLQEKLAADPQRPRYHFLPSANWMNDPNGTIFWKGKYHVFYQHNPYVAWWGMMHWGHAVSEDLVHWTHLPIALAPTPYGPDKDGCWSGCAVDNGGVPIIVYTGVSHDDGRRVEVQCIATSDDDMITWKKYPENPVIGSPPKGLEVTGFRDPCVWKEGDNWYMLIGSGIKDIGGAALLYKSKDLIRWEYLHPLCIGDKEKTGTMWECPDFFPLGDKHVLLVSTLGTTLYFVGTYADHRFHPDIRGNTDIGGHFYAARSLIDGDGRRILFGWVWEGCSEAAQRASGWAGVLSLPRVLSLCDDGTLGMEPVPELKVLRGRHYHYTEIRVTPASSALLTGVQGDCLEIDAEFDPCDAEEFCLKVRCAPDATEQTLIFYSDKSKRLNVDRERSSLSPEVSRGIQGGPLELVAGETLNLRIFLDRSVVDVFANGRTCITDRIYPSRADSLGIGLFACGSNAKLKSMDIWEMKSISTPGSSEPHR